MTIYAWPLFESTSALQLRLAYQESKTPPGRNEQAQCIDTLCIHRLVQYFDFGIPDMSSVKRRSRQPILGSLVSGSYLRFHEKNNLNLCVRYITNHAESPSPLPSSCL